jgi:hypothetical protein
VNANQYRIERLAVRRLGLLLDLGYTVHYVVPDGYRGVFTVCEDSASGTPPEQRGREFVYRIPDSGHLDSSDTTPIQTMHRATASYQSGEVIPYEGEPLEISLRGLSAVSPDGKSRDLIGTRNEVDNWRSHRVDWFRIEPTEQPPRRAD